MDSRVFNRETMLDTTVNIIPLGILLFFLVFFVVFNPWDQSLMIYLITHALTIIPFVALTIITYIAAKYI